MQLPTPSTNSAVLSIAACQTPVVNENSPLKEFERCVCTCSVASYRVSCRRKSYGASSVRCREQLVFTSESHAEQGPFCYSSISGKDARDNVKTSSGAMWRRPGVRLSLQEKPILTGKRRIDNRRQGGPAPALANAPLRPLTCPHREAALAQFVRCKS